VDVSANPFGRLGPVAVLSLLISWPALSGAQQLDGGRLFQQRCASCHAVQPGKNGVGPSLFAIVGRKAGSAEGARYSDAMRSAALVWNGETLERFLGNPRQLIPGTSMVIAVQNPGERAALVDYLETLR
jgi:cytochrome c